MGIFSFFRSRPKGTANTAKERLQVLIAHQHADSAGPDYLPKLKKDILNVIKKYVDIGEEQVVVQLDSQDDCDVLELNITLPDDAKGSTQASDKRKAGITTAQVKNTSSTSGTSDADDDDDSDESLPEKSSTLKNKNAGVGAGAGAGASGSGKGSNARHKKKARPPSSTKGKNKKNRESLS